MSDDEALRDSDEERRDALISAQRDGALAPRERAELAERLERDADAARRMEDFRRVDDALRALARQPIDEQRLAATFSRVAARLERDASAGPTSARGRWELAIGLAAAAAVAFVLLRPGLERLLEASPASPPLATRSVAPETPRPAAEPDEEWVLAIGYGDELSEIGSISSDDFEVIEQLDLLEFLLARERGDRG